MARVFPTPSGQHRTYRIDLSDLSINNFYPVIFSIRGHSMNSPAQVLPMDIAIKAPTGLASYAWNHNQIHFEANNNGWNDTKPRYLLVYAYGVYDAAELTIGCIGFGDKEGFTCVWLRGGLKYYVTSNVIPHIYENGYTTSNGEEYLPGPNMSGGATHANVSIVFTPSGQAMYLTKVFPS